MQFLPLVSSVETWPLTVVLSVFITSLSVGIFSIHGFHDEMYSSPVICAPHWLPKSFPILVFRNPGQEIATEEWGKQRH